MTYPVSEDYDQEMRDNGDAKQKKVTSRPSLCPSVARGPLVARNEVSFSRLQDFLFLRVLCGELTDHRGTENTEKAGECQKTLFGQLSALRMSSSRRLAQRIGRFEHFHFGGPRHLDQIGEVVMWQRSVDDVDGLIAALGGCG